jgi:hypothetical protein
MIKCLCKENVQDKFTGENYVAGKEYSFTEERAVEVTKSRYFEYAKVEEIKEQPKEEVVEVKPKRVKKSTK